MTSDPFPYMYVLIVCHPWYMTRMIQIRLLRIFLQGCLVVSLCFSGVFIAAASSPPAEWRRVDSKMGLVKRSVSAYMRPIKFPNGPQPSPAADIPDVFKCFADIRSGAFESSENDPWSEFYVKLFCAISKENEGLDGNCEECDGHVSKTFRISLCGLYSSTDLWIGWDANAIQTGSHLKVFTELFGSEHETIPASILNDYIDYILKRIDGELEDLVEKEIQRVNDPTAEGSIKRAAKRQFYNSTTTLMLELMSLGRSDLFQRLFSYFDECIEHDLGLEYLLLHQRIGETTEATGSKGWREIAIILIRKFPLSINDYRLKFRDFLGSETDSNRLFHHFAPLLHYFEIKSEQVFLREKHDFLSFLNHRLGNLEQVIPMGFGGLTVLDEIINRSNFNVNFGASPSLINLRRFMFRELIDYAFTHKPFEYYLKLFQDRDCPNLFESFLIYFDPTRVLLESRSPTSTGFYAFSFLAHYKTAKMEAYDGKEGKMLRFLQVAIDNVHLQAIPGNRLILVFPANLRKDFAAFYDKVSPSIYYRFVQILLAKNFGLPLTFTCLTNAKYTEFMSLPTAIEYANDQINRAARVTASLLPIQELIEDT